MNRGLESDVHISSRLLGALGGVKADTVLGGETVSLVNDGAYLWGVEDRDKGRGVFNHVLLTARTAYYLGKELREKQIPEYKNINLSTLVDAAILHDVVKLAGEDREKLTPEQKISLSLPENFREIMDEADDMGIDWLKNLGFPSEVYEAIRAHDFPQNIVEDPYWKIVLVADYMSGQKIMTVAERLQDVKTRWIDQQKEKGEKPRIEEDRFNNSERNIKSVAAGIFGAIGMEDQEFIDIYGLNSENSMQRWEKFLRSTRENSRAVEVARQVIRIGESGNYGKIRYGESRKNSTSKNRTF